MDMYYKNVNGDIKNIKGGSKSEEIEYLHLGCRKLEGVPNPL